ncbi:hypothetical protein DSL64_02930 [Dyadobacter luteus]|uniref:Rad50/SbcC-type AAA domain-containing protein n=1 Tax=Dyadobacter luteus TaxID=2259619 RepID=A0A3D8YFH9_9BACT|nr:hypothetical protein [Dyadobacter luteus]REA63417.1 hypothetical protein DSL64_02930 [Dyadobacter luteus]
MGSLIIKKVIYSGDAYYYASPELNKGINIVVGDNGSGKSTFSYFIEYGLGGKIKPFTKAEDKQKYSLIIEDTNNYVQLDILINDASYSLKRFIGSQDIFVGHNDFVETFPLDRKTAPFIFSDWILGKLDIPVFELHIGASHWFFNFNDLFRLLNYDQNTEPRKIYKEPVAENFIADSIVIRKSIFEILLGMSSADYFKKMDTARAALKAKDLAKGLLEGFLENHDISEHSYVQSDRKVVIENEISGLQTQRDEFLKKSTNSDDKLGELAEIQSNLVELQLKASRDRIKIINLTNEESKIAILHEGLKQEINQIEKIIFTHEKLDLFAMEVCPFCMSEQNIEKGHCICGSKFNDDDYEKFVYNTSEYKDILSHKQKSIKAIDLAVQTYQEEVKELTSVLKRTDVLIEEYTEKLKNIILTAQFAGNTTRIDDLNDRIIKLKDELLQVNSALRNSDQERRLRANFDEKKDAFSKAQQILSKAKIAYDENNAATIELFNETYSTLLAESSYKSITAYIDDAYMPYIDNGEYKANSSEVPKRLMYYFTILSLSLKLESVKHPRFLLIDTPEASGIDTDHLNQNLLLLEKAIALGMDETKKVKDYQVILTTGYGKLPVEFENYVIEKFSEKDNNFILKPKAVQS